MKDLNLKKGAPVINKDITVLKQEIDILFETTPGDLHGNVLFGTEWDKYLYELQFSAEEMEAAMMTDLAKMDLLGFTPKVKAYLLEGTERDIMIVDVSLSRGYESYTNTYKIE